MPRPNARTKPRRTRSRATKVTAAGLVALLALTVTTACSSTNTKASRTKAPRTSAGDPGLTKLLPRDIASRGVIRVSGSQDVPPWNYVDGSSVRGIDTEILNHMGSLLGVRFVYQRNAFSSEIPALQAKRFDLIMDEIADTTEREKVVSFVDYSVELNSIVVKKGNPQHINGLNGLCGHSVALQPGQSAIPIVAAQQPKCAAAGKNSIKVVSTPTTSSGYTAVASGRVDSTMNGYSTMAYTIAQGGAAGGLEIAPGSFGRVQVGIAFRKGETALGEVLRQTLAKMIADGSYAAIMAKYKVKDLSVSKALVNNAAANEN